MSERRLTKIYFRGNDAVTLYYPATPGGPTGNEPSNEADAVGGPGRRAWEIWLNETSPGVGTVKIWHKDRPTGMVTVPLSGGSVKSYEERWEEAPYKGLLEREAAEAKAKKTAAEAAKQAEAEKAKK